MTGSGVGRCPALTPRKKSAYLFHHLAVLFPPRQKNSHSYRTLISPMGRRGSPFDAGINMPLLLPPPPKSRQLFWVFGVRFAAVVVQCCGDWMASAQWWRSPSFLRPIPSCPPSSPRVSLTSPPTVGSGTDGGADGTLAASFCSSSPPPPPTKVSTRTTYTASLSLPRGCCDRGRRRCLLYTPPSTSTSPLPFLLAGRKHSSHEWRHHRPTDRGQLLPIASDFFLTVVRVRPNGLNVWEGDDGVLVCCFPIMEGSIGGWQFSGLSQGDCKETSGKGFSAFTYYAD